MWLTRAALSYTSAETDEQVSGIYQLSPYCGWQFYRLEVLHLSGHNLDVCDSPSFHNWTHRAEYKMAVLPAPLSTRFRCIRFISWLCVTDKQRLVLSNCFNMTSDPWGTAVNLPATCCSKQNSALCTHTVYLCRVLILVVDHVIFGQVVVRVAPY